MKISIAIPKDGTVNDKTIDFVKWVCEQAISQQSVTKPVKNEHLVLFDVDITVKPSAQ
jgi:hypothetical protein